MLPLLSSAAYVYRALIASQRSRSWPHSANDCMCSQMNPSWSVLAMAYRLPPHQSVLVMPQGVAPLALLPLAQQYLCIAWLAPQPKQIYFHPIRVAHRLPADVQSGVAPLLKLFLPCSFSSEMLCRGLRLTACHCSQRSGLHCPFVWLILCAIPTPRAPG